MSQRPRSHHRRWPRALGMLLGLGLATACGPHASEARPGHAQVSIAMLAATHDPFIAYEPGPSALYPNHYYPGMERTRDVWLSAMGIGGPAQVHQLPDVAADDSHRPHTGMNSSRIERHRYPPGPDGQEFWYYKAIGMGHWWPSPEPMWAGLWPRFGKANRDIDFADHAWEFFRRHSKRPVSPR